MVTTIFLMKLLQLEGVLAPEIEIIVVFIQVGRLGELGAGDVPQRMEKESIDNGHSKITDVATRCNGCTGNQGIQHGETVNAVLPLQLIFEKSGDPWHPAPVRRVFRAYSSQQDRHVSSSAECRCHVEADSIPCRGRDTAEWVAVGVSAG